MLPFFGTELGNHNDPAPLLMEDYAEQLEQALARNKVPTRVTYEPYTGEPDELNLLMDLYLYEDPKFARKASASSSSSSSSK